MRVPLFDLRLDDAAVQAVADTLRSGWLTMGPRTAEFEEAFAARLGVRHAVAVSSCTAALHLAYLAAGVGPGDEVIVPALTFVATAAAVRHCGGTPVIADIAGRRDFGISVEDVAARITPRTRAVCAVHYAGYPAEVEALRDLCDARGIALIEDAAHAPTGFTRAGHPLGTVGLAGCFSFFSNKVLSCGEGGLLATDDDGVADLARRLRSHAMTSGTWDRHRGHAKVYDVVETGFNYRLDEPRAALLLARLPGLDDDVAQRRALVARYRAALAPLRGVSVPYRAADVELSSCYVMPVLVAGRDEVRDRLLDVWGVQTSVLYPSLTELTAYTGAGSCPRAEDVAAAELTLPLYPHLSESDLDYVVEALATEVGAGDELRGDAESSLTWTS
jgi:dTDP-4-amino-4,6-dideoxygalactose transaminase